MPKPVQIAALIGDVLYQLSCQYHGDLGSFDTPLGVNQAAADHLRTQHVDLAGVIAAGASVLISAFTNVTPAHLDAIDAAQKTSSSPGSQSGN